jgi:hypothetical protein
MNIMYELLLFFIVCAFLDYLFLDSGVMQALIKRIGGVNNE